MNIPVRIVLVRPSHPGNIGAAARAMKTMGLSDLALVEPRLFPHAEATARASGADDVLDAARRCGSLQQAVGDCSFVVAASARLRSLAWPTVDPRRCAELIWQRLPEGQAAIVMGPEQSGLTNEELACCGQLVHIPAEPGFMSLNLAMAVQILCYELRVSRSLALPSGRDARAVPPASVAELEGFHRHLEELLSAVGFLRPEHPRQLKLKLRRIFSRAQPDQNEINILRGMLAALDPRRLHSKPAGRGPEAR